MPCWSSTTLSELGTTHRTDRFFLGSRITVRLGTAPVRPHVPREGGAVLNCGRASPSPKTMTHKGVAMRYREIEYSVVQGIERRLWKWAATVAGTKISGQGSTRDQAKKRKSHCARTQKQRFKHGYSWRRSR